MVRNEEYWGELASVDSVTIKEVPEAGTRTAMLQTGEADMIYPTAADQLTVMEDNGDINVHAVTSNIMRYVTLNTNIEALSDVRVRQAMNYAIDKDAYCQVMYSGYGTKATSVVPNCILYYEEQTPYDYDLDKAKELLAEAGYEDGFDLTIWGDNTTQEIKGMTFIKQQLEQIGINVEVVPMDSATVSDKIYVDLEDAEINMWYVNWSASDFSMDGSVRALLYSTMCPPTSANTVYYNNEEFDSLLDEALATADPDTLTDLYAQAQEIAWNDAVWLFLGNDQLLYSTKSYLSGAYVAPDGCINFANAVLAQ
jgi:glutathione transport system substrate-binding protein